MLQRFSRARACKWPRSASHSLPHSLTRSFSSSHDSSTPSLPHSTPPLAPPGLHYYRAFLTPEQQSALTDASLSLLENIHDSRDSHTHSLDTDSSSGSDSDSGRRVKTTTSLSKQHNLTTDEYYERVEVTDESEVVTAGASGAVSKGKGVSKGVRKRRAQYFDQYGDPGHQLTYFMNNSNIPSYVMDDVISRLVQMKEIKELYTSSEGVGDAKDLNWMFTFNTYSSHCDSDIIPGFPYHVDSDFNGDVTVILSLMCGASMELRPLPKAGEEGNSTEKNPCHMRIELSPGSLLLLSGEARWKWQHRIVPRTGTGTGTGRTDSDDEDDSELPDVQRISLVLGCRNTNRSS